MKKFNLFKMLAVLIVLITSINTTWGNIKLQKNAVIYFDNTTSQWNYTYIYLDAADSHCWQMGHIDHTNLYVHNRTDNNWDDCSMVRIYGDKDSWGNGQNVGGWSNLYNNAENITNPHNSSGDFISFRLSVLTPSSTGSKEDCCRANLSYTYLGEGDDAAEASATMNRTIMVGAKTSTDNGGSYSDAASDFVSFTGSSYSFSSAFICGTAETLSDNTITCGYTAATTLTAPAKSGYVFEGWYNSSGVRQTTNASLSLRPTSNATYYAYYRQVYSIASGATVVWDFGTRTPWSNVYLRRTAEDNSNTHEQLTRPGSSGYQWAKTYNSAVSGIRYYMFRDANGGDWSDYGQTTNMYNDISGITIYTNPNSTTYQDAKNKLDWQIATNCHKGSSGRTIYFDDSNTGWKNKGGAANREIYFNYGVDYDGNSSGFHRKIDFAATKVPGTANLWKLKASETEDTNQGKTDASGQFSHDIYFQKWYVSMYYGYTNHNPITDSHVLERTEIYTDEIVANDFTLIPTSKKSGGTGADGDPYIWNTTKKTGHTHTVTIGSHTNGTITLHYTDENEVEQNPTETTEVAHTCIINATAEADNGYDYTSMTMGGAAYTPETDHIVRDNVTFAATFTAHTYSITLNAGDHGASAGAATVDFDATSSTISTPVTANAGYEVEGYYDGETKVLNANGSFAAANVDGYITDGKWSKYDADATLTAKFNTVTLHFTKGVYWDDASNWVPACVPTIDHDVVIEKRCIIQNNDAQAKSVKIDHYRDNGPNLDIQGNYSDAGALLVKEGISAKHAEEGEYEATDDLDLYLEIGQGKNAALICGNASDNTKASCIFHSKIYRFGTYYINQYVGVPFSDMDPFQWYGVYIFEYDAEHDNWKTPAGEYAYLKPYTAYDIISKTTGGAVEFYMNGTLILPGITGDGRLHTYNCAWRETSPGSIDKVDGHQDFLFANSWLAPISIKDIKPADYNNLVSTIYIFNAGYIPESGDEKVIGDLSGQWSSIPFGSAAYMTDNNVIPAGQAFLVTATDEGASLTLDYKKHVYDPAASAGTINTSPTRAPKRVMEEDAPIRLKMAVRNNDNEVNADVLYLFERGDFSTDYDEGWDGYKVMGEAYAPQLYVENGDAQYAVDATPELDNTNIGFKAGTIANEYTFVFEYDDDEPLYLYDKETQDFTRISNEATYTFQTKDNAEHSRFALTRSNAPQVVTAFENAEYETEIRAEKFIENSMLFIRRGDKVYSIDGTQVK